MQDSCCSSKKSFRRIFIGIKLLVARISWVYLFFLPLALYIFLVLFLSICKMYPSHLSYPSSSVCCIGLVLNFSLNVVFLVLSNFVFPSIFLRDLISMYIDYMVFFMKLSRLQKSILVS